MHIAVLSSVPNKTLVFPERERKLFLHKKTITYLSTKIKEAGFSVIPMELYFVGSLIKIKVSLAKGRKAYQKKQVLKERTLEKEAKMMLKSF
jgi:SsrA-binding protein